MNCMRWSIGDVVLQGMGHLSVGARECDTTVTDVPGLKCYLCVWTVPSGLTARCSRRAKRARTLDRTRRNTVPRWPKQKPRPGIDEYGRTPLWYKAADGDLAAATSAIAAGADPSQGDDVGYTPLHVSVQNGHVAIVELLLKAGTNPNAHDNHGNGLLWT